MASGWPVVGAGHGGGAVTVVESATQGGLKGRFKPYPAYKDSGVEWLGEIPEHWDVKRLRSSVKSCQNGVWGDEPDGLQDIACVRVADFDRVSFRVNIEDPTLRSIEPKVAAARGLKQGELLLEKSGGGENQPVGAVVLYDHCIPAVCSNFVARVVLAKGFDSRFMTYLHAALYALRINTRHIKQSTGIQNLDSANYLDEAAGLPSESEQRSIAIFLDRETARIDALVAKKQRLIELLVEQRTSLITRAVTKGLDPTAPMKDSGVEWLGRIPEHWEVSRLGSCCRFRAGKAHEPFVDDQGSFVCVNSRFVSTEGKTIKLCTENLTPAWKDDVLMVMSDLPNGRALAKAFHVAEDHRYAVNQRVCALSVFRDDPRFFYYQLNRSPGLLCLDDGINQTHISNSAFTKLPVVVPPIEEQAEIRTFLDRKTADLVEIVVKSEAFIQLLRELRTTLISAAVTGKIDVRETVL